MNDDEILAIAREVIGDTAGRNLIVTGAEPKGPQDTRDLVGLCAVGVKAVASAGIGRRARVTPQSVRIAAQQVARTIEAQDARSQRRQFYA